MKPTFQALVLAEKMLQLSDNGVIQLYGDHRGTVATADKMTGLTHVILSF